jgi:hypothetical protein
MASSCDIFDSFCFGTKLPKVLAIFGTFLLRFRVCFGQVWFTDRVTRLGEFSTVGRLFSLGHFFENDNSCPKKFSRFFLPSKTCNNCYRNMLCYILGHFFTNSSGHPVHGRDNGSSRRCQQFTGQLMTS